MALPKSEQMIPAKERFEAYTCLKHALNEVVRTCPKLELICCYSVFQEEPLHVEVEALVDVELPKQISKLRTMTYLLLGYKRTLPTELIRMVGGMLY